MPPGTPTEVAQRGKGRKRIVFVRDVGERLRSAREKLSDLGLTMGAMSLCTFNGTAYCPYPAILIGRIGVLKSF